MAIYLTQESKVLVQGMTGAEGMKHTRRMLAAGTDVVGGVNPRKAGRTVEFDERAVPVFGSVREGVERTGADVTVVFVPPRLRQGGGRRGRRRRHRPRRRHHRWHPGPRLRRLHRVRRDQGHPRHRPQLSRRDHARPVQRGHHPARHHQVRPHRTGLQIGHAHPINSCTSCATSASRPASASAATRSSAPATSTASPRSRTTPTPSCRPHRRDRRRRGGARGGLHPRPRHQAGRRLHRRLHGARGTDHGPRRRDRVRVLGHRAGEEGRAGGRRGCGSAARRPGRHATSPPPWGAKHGTEPPYDIRRGRDTGHGDDGRRVRARPQVRHLLGRRLAALPDRRTRGVPGRPCPQPLERRLAGGRPCPARHQPRRRHPDHRPAPAGRRDGPRKPYARPSTSTGPGATSP